MQALRHRARKFWLPALTGLAAVLTLVVAPLLYAGVQLPAGKTYGLQSWNGDAWVTTGTIVTRESSLVRTFTGGPEWTNMTYSWDAGTGKYESEGGQTVEFTDNSDGTFGVTFGTTDGAPMNHSPVQITET